MADQEPLLLHLDNKFSVDGDRSFDDLAEKFGQNIYGTRKGQLRLDIVINDLEAHLPLKFPSQPLIEKEVKIACEEVDDKNTMNIDETADLTHNITGKPGLSSVSSSSALSSIPSSTSDTEISNHQQKKLVVLDAGGGMGQLSALLASMGHKVIICDISSVMLEKAKIEFDKVVGHSNHDTTFIQCAAQDILKSSAMRSALNMSPLAKDEEKNIRVEKVVDLVLFHAVVEWMKQPLEALSVLRSCLKDDGYLSCLFYNKNALVWRNLMNGAFAQAANPTDLPTDVTAVPPVSNAASSSSSDVSDVYVFPTGEENMTGKQRRKRKRRIDLSPTNPQEPDTIIHWIKLNRMNIKAYSGIRMIYDHMPHNIRDTTPYEQLLHAELRWGRQEPYRSLARYLHVLVCHSE